MTSKTIELSNGAKLRINHVRNNDSVYVALQKVNDPSMKILWTENTDQVYEYARFKATGIDAGRPKMSVQEFWKKLLAKLNLMLADIFQSAGAGKQFSAQEWENELDSFITNVAWDGEKLL